MSLLTDEERLNAKSYLVGLWDRIEKMKSEECSTSSDVEDEPSQIIENSSDEEASDDEFEKILAAKNKAKLALKTSASSAKRNIIPLLDAYYQNTEPLNRKANVLEEWEKRRAIDPEL